MTRFNTASTLLLAVGIVGTAANAHKGTGSSGFRYLRRDGANATAAATVALTVRPQLGAANSQALFPVWKLAKESQSGMVESNDKAGWSPINVTSVSLPGPTGPISAYQINTHSPEGYLSWDHSNGTEQVVIAAAGSYPLDATSFNILCDATQGSQGDPSAYICALYHGDPAQKKCAIKGSNGSYLRYVIPQLPRQSSSGSFDLQSKLSDALVRQCAHCSSSMTQQGWEVV